MLPKTFLKYSAKTVLCALGYIFNNVNRGKVQKPDKQLGHIVKLKFVESIKFLLYNHLVSIYAEETDSWQPW